MTSWRVSSFRKWAAASFRGTNLGSGSKTEKRALNPFTTALGHSSLRAESGCVKPVIVRAVLSIEKFVDVTEMYENTHIEPATHDTGWHISLIRLCFTRFEFILTHEIHC